MCNSFEALVKHQHFPSRQTSSHRGARSKFQCLFSAVVTAKFKTSASSVCNSIQNSSSLFQSVTTTVNMFSPAIFSVERQVKLKKKKARKACDLHSLYGDSHLSPTLLMLGFHSPLCSVLLSLLFITSNCLFKRNVHITYNLANMQFHYCSFNGFKQNTHILFKGRH